MHLNGDDAMTNRREFIRIGVSATAWPLVAGAAHAAGVDTDPRTMPLSAVIYDSRFSEGLAFAQRCEAAGIPTRAIDGDMTRLWYDDIHHLWQRGPTAIAGLTAYGPMFCFAELARDARMRIVFRAEHRPASSGSRHALTGPMPMVSSALRACRNDTSLGAAMADIVMACPGGRVEIASAATDSGTAVTALDDVDDALYTWVIAPAVRA